MLHPYPNVLQPRLVKRFRWHHHTGCPQHISGKTTLAPKSFSRCAGRKTCESLLKKGEAQTSMQIRPVK